VDNRCYFTAEEDEQLRYLVASTSAGDWRSVSRGMHDRTPRQCRERWKYYLAPELRQGGWADSEDALLLRKHLELGTKWAMIAKFFPNRTDTMVKNRVNLLKRKACKQLNPARKQRIAEETSESVSIKDEVGAGVESDGLWGEPLDGEGDAEWPEDTQTNGC
jgi:hypothetical protein